VEGIDAEPFLGFRGNEGSVYWLIGAGLKLCLGQGGFSFIWNCGSQRTILSLGNGWALTRKGNVPETAPYGDLAKEIKARE
jgi:hypothetical protein